MAGIDLPGTPPPDKLRAWMRSRPSSPGNGTTVLIFVCASTFTGVAPKRVDDSVALKCTAAEMANLAAPGLDVNFHPLSKGE
jgi:hypothetical protein